jgi:hypothetical protein
MRLEAHFAPLGEANEPAQREWWTVRQLAEHYGLSRRSIYDAIAGGDLVTHRFGQGRGGMRIAETDRLEWERRCRDAKTAPAPPPVTRSRLVTGESVKKHFGL